MKKDLLIAFLLAFLIVGLILLVNIVYSSFFNELVFENYANKILEKNKESVFYIDKIVCFSSCSADSNINTNNTTTINNLVQYTDIAVFINTSTDSLDSSNTLKSVSLKNISINSSPSLGTPCLYFKGLGDFAQYSIDEKNVLSDKFDFKVSYEDNIDYSEPVLYNNCANPITLSYVNSNIVNGYTVLNSNSSISYDGSLLKKCNVLLNDLNCSISFSIVIENNLGEIFECPVYIDIPLSNKEKSIYNGNYLYSYNPGYSFFKF